MTKPSKPLAEKPWRDMTAEERQEVCREDAFREAREQGLPEVMEDPAVYAELGRIFAMRKRAQPAADDGPSAA